MLTNNNQGFNRTGVDCANTAQLVALWLHGKTSLTQRAYEYDVRCLIAFLNNRSPEQVRLSDGDLKAVTLNDVQAFDDFLIQKGLSDTSRARRLASIKSLLSFGQKIGYLDFNVGSALLLPKPKDTLAERILTELEVMTMVALTPPGRERLLIQFLYYTGARVGEVAQLTWRDIQPNRDGQGQVTLYGKGQETRTVIIPTSLYQGLLKIRGDSLNIDKLGQSSKKPINCDTHELSQQDCPNLSSFFPRDNEPSSAVFVSRKGKKPLQDRQIRKIVNEAASRAGITGSVSPHWLRHSHASHSLDRGAAPQLVQKTLGHKSLDTTTRYAHARPNDSSGLYLPS